jgi:hypothetical protein
LENQPTRSYTRLAIAIVVAALVIGAAIYASSYLGPTIPTSCDSSSTVHCVVFQQLGACFPTFWGVPWSVTIDNMTEVQPFGMPLPLQGSVLFGTSNQNHSVIVFSLPDGSYQYRVRPDFFTPASGTVDVNGTDALVQIAYTGTSCVATVTSTSSSINTAASVTSAPTMTVNGSLYYADNISKDISVGNPGDSYFLNGSVTFLGVKFETLCPPSYSGCPVPPGTTITTYTTMYIGAIRLNATFPDSRRGQLDGVT